MSKDLGPKPDARIEPGEPNPGGVDAVDDVPEDAEPAIPNLADGQEPGGRATRPPTRSTQTEDTSTGATESSGSQSDADAEDPEEAPA